MRKNTRLNSLILGLLLILILIVIANIQVSTYKGVDYVVKGTKIPLYVKGIHFLSRCYQLKAIAADITKNSGNDEARVLAIFDWVCKNIKTDIPEGWPIVDDHILNVIIRGYGTADQVTDVFCAMCVYEKIPAKRHSIYIKVKDKKKRLIIALVKLNEQWRMLDPYNGNYFKNEEGGIATINDLISNPALKRQMVNKPIVNKLAYAEYFENLSPISNVKFLRAGKQMPLSRFIYEIKKGMGYER